MAGAFLTLQAVGHLMSERWRIGANRVAARRAVIGRAPTAFLSQPEPKAIGSAARARQYVAGNFMFAGDLVEHQGSVWDLDPPNEAFSHALHGFAWIDDFAAVGDKRSAELLRAWLLEWIARFGTGKGPGWQPDLAGRRLIRWISHTPFILKGVSPDVSRLFFKSLGRQSRFLASRWRAASPGLPRFEAATGLVYAGLSLEGRSLLLRRGIAALGRECANRIDASGGIVSRSPEELMEVFTLLVWAARTLEETGHEADRRHLAAIARIAPTLRALRMGDGSLARFHGGRRGEDGRLDQSLADSRVRGPARPDRAMGYLRLSAGRTICVIDAERPPEGPASAHGHAGTLGIELSAGRRPLIVNIGAGAFFGAEWRRAGRATGSHSAVMVEDMSSSRLIPEGFVSRSLGERLITMPREVVAERADDLNGAWVLTSHDGYVPSHGLLHERRLFLSPDGRDLRGEDTLSATSERERKRFAELAGENGVSFTSRFHVHPDIEATLALAETAVSLKMLSGETWVFRQSGGALTLEDSVYLDQARLRPRATKQIVVSGRVSEYWGQITWAFKRAEEGSRNPRDFLYEERAPEEVY